MPLTTRPDPLTSRTGVLALLLLLSLFLVTGTVGHDPWKLDDATHFGIIWRALSDGQALRFMLPGEVLPRPPLYYWIGGASGALFGSILPLHDAVRAASALLAGLTAGALWWAGRLLLPKTPQFALAAPLALLGSVGFLIHSHEAQPLLAATASLAIVLAGLAEVATRPVRGAAVAALGVAGLLLSTGLAFLPAIALLSLAALSRGNRQTRAWALAALSAGVLLAALWLWRLHLAWPELAGRWWVQEWADLIPSARTLPTALAYLDVLPWFSWPALPLALWALWMGMRQRDLSPLWLPLAGFLGAAISLALSGDTRNANANLLTVPLALFAPYAMATLRRGAASALDWFGRMTFSVAAALIWLGWSAIYFAIPAQIGRNFARLGPDFSVPASPLNTALAAIATIAWLVLLIRSTRYPLRGLVHWMAGMTLLWGLVMTLWLPWIEHIKSYRGIAAQVARALPKAHGEPCIIASRLGDAQRASLEYFLNRRFVSSPGRPECPAMIVQGGRSETPPPAPWVKHWEGARPGDRNERIRLYLRPQ